MLRACDFKVKANGALEIKKIRGLVVVMVVGVEVFLVVAVVVAAHSSRLLHSELPFRSLPH